jgi:hypothetical protein
MVDMQLLASCRRRTGGDQGHTLRSLLVPGPGFYFCDKEGMPQMVGIKGVWKSGPTPSGNNKVAKQNDDERTRSLGFTWNSRVGRNMNHL